MPPLDEFAERKSLHQVVEQVSLYPIEAFDFIQRGLSYTVAQVHGEGILPDASRHISGQQLCDGLREFALMEWGFLAGTVLRRWNITSTMDFGRIVFALVEHGFLGRTDEDSLDDFRGVFEFKAAFEADYRIESKT